jgi:hypothetical protein
MKNYKCIHWINVHKFNEILKTIHVNVNINSQLELHHLPFNDMQLYKIENDIKKQNLYW